MSRIEFLHKFFSIPENYHGTLCKIEWAIDNLMQFEMGKIDEITDIDLEHELGLFFDWIKFDLSGRAYRNKKILYVISRSTWLVGIGNEDKYVNNIIAKKQLAGFLKLAKEIDIWLKLNYKNEQEPSDGFYYKLGDEIRKSEKELVSQNLQNKYLEIFIKGGFQLFSYLDENYTSNNKALKAKYSNLYHFLKYNEVLVCSQKDYIRFIKKYREVSMSKILPKPTKYDNLEKKLALWMSDFKTKNKK